MAKETPKDTPSSQPPKLPRLTEGQKIQKRPLLHPAIAAPRTGSATEKIIYVSASSPFISIIKRAKTYLSEIEKRSSASISLSETSDRELLRKLGSAVADRGKGKKEEVVLKGTGKAIEKVLQVGSWFANEAEGKQWKVEWRTGSVGAVDDVVDGDGEITEEGRLRRASCLEARISIR